MKSFKKLLSTSLLLILSITLISCSKEDKNEPLSKTDYFMGTIIKVTLYDKKDSKIIDRAFEKVKEIEELVSINRNGTELDKVNENAGIAPTHVSKDTFNIVKKGLEYSNLTNGYFDITIGPLVKLWSIGLPEAKVPTQAEIDEKIKYINYKDLVLDEANQTVFLKKKGMLIDLGGIAKGYTADEIASILKEEGVEQAIINLGGNVYALGEKEKNTPWKIGVQNPLENRGEIVGSLSLSNKSIVTSGIYERFIEDGDKRYHHILSPFDGYPYDNNIAGVTIISDKSIDGDALSTSVFAMGVDEGLKFVNNNPEIEAIFVTKDNKIYLSENVKDNFKLTDTTFEIMN